MSPVIHGTFVRESSLINSSGLFLLSVKSKAITSTLCFNNSAIVHAPIHPPAPVTNTGPLNFSLGIEK